MKSPLGNRILMTGGAGFLGRGILDRAHREQWDCQFTIYSRDEEKQWRVRNKYPDVVCVLGDITDTVKLTQTMAGHDTVLHLAAHKFVPEAESNVVACIKANIDGTRSVADAVSLTHPHRAILISTDKACSPINLYGMTKAVAERVWGEAYIRTGEYEGPYRVTRYGNVIGSTGSVLPLFIEQLRKTGLLSITSFDMTRFMMPIGEAVDCIIAAYDCRAFMVVPSPKAATLASIASAAMLYADMPGAKTGTIGVRPGEKMHESLLDKNDGVRVMDYRAPFYFLGAPNQKFNTKYAAVKLDVTSEHGAIMMNAAEIAKVFAEAVQI